MPENERYYSPPPGQQPYYNGPPPPGQPPYGQPYYNGPPPPPGQYYGGPPPPMNQPYPLIQVQESLPYGYDRHPLIRFFIGPVETPYFSYISALGMTAMLIYEFVQMHNLTGDVIETNPFNPMIGPSFQVGLFQDIQISQQRLILFLNRCSSIQALVSHLAFAQSPVYLHQQVSAIATEILQIRALLKRCADSVDLRMVLPIKRLD